MSKPYEAIDWVLRNTAGISALVGSRVTHAFANRSGATMPNISFFEVGGPFGFTGFERQDFQISCRGKKIEDALDLARVVTETFDGSASTGINGYVNSFSIARSFQAEAAPIITEANSIYNVPVTVTVIYPSSTVS